MGIDEILDEIYNDEDRELLYELATMIAAYTNPQVFFDLAWREDKPGIPELKRIAELKDMKNRMEKLLG